MVCHCESHFTGAVVLVVNLIVGDCANKYNQVYMCLK